MSALRIAYHRYVPLRNSTQGFVMYNAALRPSAPRYSPRLSSSQLKDLLCTTQRTPQLGSGHLNDSQRDFAYCDAPQFNATICLSIYYRTALLRSARHLSVALRNATQGFVYYLVSRRHATPLNSSPLDARICLPPLRPAYRLTVALLYATQRFVCQFIIAPRHGSRQRTAAQLALPRRAATQRNELKLN